METWGDLACFTRPESKVERLSYPVPTPSALRGLLSAIYSKPNEFYWQINRVEVLKPIRYISFKRNEVKSKVGNSANPILVEDDRTQRQSVMLKDVHYRVYASIIKRDGFKGTLTALYEQADRRIRGGKCFYQPCLGTRECVAYFSPNESGLLPCKESLDVGLMLYDVFDLHSFEVTTKSKPYITLFKAKLVDGVLEIPDFDSGDVLRP